MIINKDEIVIDGNKQLIPIGNKEREYHGKSIAHYTPIDNAISILRDKLILSRISLDYKSQKTFANHYKEKGFSKDNYKQTFSTSFTDIQNDADSLWGCKKNASMVKIDFLFKKSVDYFFDNSRCFICYKDKELKEQVELLSMYGNMQLEGKITKPIYITIKYIIDDYVKKDAIKADNNGLELCECLMVDNELFTIIGETSTHDLDQREWKTQKEIKMVLYLRTTHEVKCRKFNYIMIPITYDDVERIAVTYDEKCDEKAKTELRNVLKETGVPYQEKTK